MKQMGAFKRLLRWFIFSLFILLIAGAHPAEVYVNPLVVDAGESFSFHITARNAAGLQSFLIHLHLPIEVISRVQSIEPGGANYAVFDVDSYYDETLKSVVRTIHGEFKQPVSGDAILFKVNATASSTAGYSNLGVAVLNSELAGAFVHGGSIYVLDPDWPWYDIQINYQNAFHRLDFDNSGRVDQKDLLYLHASWHQNFATDLPLAPTPTPISSQPTPTPTPPEAPSIENFIGTWTFNFLQNTLIGTKVHVVFDAVLNEDGLILLQAPYANENLGTYTYDETTGSINGVFAITRSSPFNPVNMIDYFINFDGAAGAGNAIEGDAQFTYHTKDLQIAGYQSYGLTITDAGNFTAVKKP
ncbi:MAG: hypothetical protein JXR73_21200 [Candidatus Omnitrophica bacterium]|nr:hypothetical protein [Candidatus Omnitrophota bacterium]